MQAQILNLLKQLQRELGVSYLFITHHHQQIVVMNRGKVEEAEEVDAVLNSPASAARKRCLRQCRGSKAEI